MQHATTPSAVATDGTPRTGRPSHDGGLASPSAQTSIAVGHTASLVRSFVVLLLGHEVTEATLEIALGRHPEPGRESTRDLAAAVGDPRGEPGWAGVTREVLGERGHDTAESCIHPEPGENRSGTPLAPIRTLAGSGRLPLPLRRGGSGSSSQPSRLSHVFGWGMNIGSSLGRFGSVARR